MIKKLRRKFIWIAMCSMIFVLGTIVAVINVINYSKADEYSDKVISVLMDNEGGFPQDFPMRPGMGNNGMTPETPFEARFFTVMLNDNGEVVFSDTKQIAAITPQTAEKYAKNLYANGETAGMYDDYKYRVKETDEGTLYIFLDCTREMNSFRGFLQTSILISIGGLAVVFILIIIFSRIALKPVEESYQKQKHFITNASHDIKTPLTIINAGAEVIELEYGEGEWTKEIKKQTQRLTALTDKLVFLSRMEEENQKISMREFNLSELIEEAVAPYENMTKAKGFLFSFDCQSGIIYKGNEEMLSQAIALLMDNAIKCNLYFDTPDFLLIRRSIEKPIYKEKLRLRSYGKATPEKEVFPELKKKYKGIVYKRRLEMTESKAMACLLGKLSFPDTQIGREISYCFERYKNLAPRVFLSYEREAFYAKDSGDFRMTFDKNILWRDYDLSLCSGIYGTPILDSDQILLEVKTSGAIPLWLTSWLSENIFIFRNRFYFPKRVDDRTVCVPFALRIVAVILQR